MELHDLLLSQGLNSRKNDPQLDMENLKKQIQHKNSKESDYYLLL